MRNEFKLLAITVIAVIVVFSMTACGSSPNSSSKYVDTVLEKVTIDLDSDDGGMLLSQAVIAYASKYSYYDMHIEVNDIKFLVDGNYSGYKNCFEITKVERKNLTGHFIIAQHNVISVALLFADKPFEEGISSGISWSYDRRYSTGEREKEQTERLAKAEWDNFFESKYNEALLKLSIEKQKYPIKDNVKLDINIHRDERSLIFYKAVHGLWFSSKKERYSY